MLEPIDSSKLELALQEADALPPCPAVLAKVGELSRDPSSTARDLGRLIATDEALTSRLIRRVNSAFYGLRGTISTVTQAVVILGYQEIRNIVYSVQAEEIFRNRVGSTGIDVLALWDHSLRVAILAREFSYRVRHPIPEEVFVAGVIHDIGQVIMSDLIGESYRHFTIRAHKEALDLAAAENSAFGVNHTEIGLRLTTAWDFPQPLQEAVHHHHGIGSDQVKSSSIAPMILAGNTTSLALKRGWSLEDALSLISKDVRDLLRLDLVRMEEVVASANQEYARIRGSFDLIRDHDTEDKQR